MKSLFIHIFDFFENRKPALWGILIGLFVLFAFLSSRISFEEDITKMLNFDAKAKTYNSIVQSTKLVDKLIVIVSLKDTNAINQEKLITFSDSLGTRLSHSSPGLIKKISLKIEEENLIPAYTIFLRNIPVFIEEADYKSFDTLFTPANLNCGLQRNLQTLSSPVGLVSKLNLQFDPVGIATNFLKRLRDFQTTASLSPVNGYLFSKDGKHLVFYIEPVNPANETRQNGHLIDDIDQSIKSLSGQVNLKDVSCRYFGSSAISVGNARQLQRDTILTISISGIALILLLVFVFKKRRIPLLILLTIVFAGGFALAAVAMIKTSVSLIAIGAGSVILGIAVNYPIHLLSHKLQESDIRNVIREMVVPLTLGSATTIGGFFFLLFMKAELLHDLGLFGAFSLIGAALFTLIFLPHMIGDLTQAKSSVTREWLEKISNISFEKKKIPLAIIFIVTPVLFYFAPKVRFDSDLMNLNYISKDLQSTQELLNQINGGAKRSVYAISYGKTREDAIAYSYGIKELTDSLNTAGVQCSYSSVTCILPPVKVQKQRVERWNAYWNVERKATALKNLGTAAAELGFNDDAFGEFTAQIDKGAHPLSAGDYNYLIAAFAKDLMSHKDSLFTLVSQVKVTPEKQETISKQLLNLPGITVIDWKMMTNQLLKVINNDFNLLFILTAALVLLALLLTYGRIELSLVTFIPMVVSWIWILGLMALLNLRFNLVNIILSTFIFGLGDDFCIFVMDGLQQQNKTGKQHFSSIRIGIYLSSLTTIIGLGVLIFAQHPALRSLAFVSIVGILSVLFVSQTLEPYLFNLFITNPQKKGLAPLTFFTLLKSVFAFSYFIFGSILLSVIGILIVPFRYLARKSTNYFYHWLIQRFTQSLLILMANIKKNYFNPEHEKFSKPAIIISNHQSVLDILLLISLNPRIILLTNKWVWNSPVFGFVVRAAGYMTVANGIEAGIDKLKSAVAVGYSIAIFPEGTRSPEGTLQRFHKGAFYLANELGLDILPILLHGTSHCLKKGSFVVLDETISLRYLKRIPVTDLSWGVTYQERAKSITRHFKNEYAILAAEQETPRYYRNQMISGYLFKGPILEWYLKVKIRLENNYLLFNELVPKKGIIVDAGCGYGFLPYMLSFLSPGRTVSGIDYDEEKIEVASNCYFNKGKVRFETGNLVTHDFGAADCYILSDVLHYLAPIDRKTVLTHCMDRLNPGGSIVVRDADQSKTQRHKGSRFTEVLSTRIFRFNKTENSLGFFTADEIIDLAGQYGLSARVIDNTRFTSNIMIVLNKK